MLQFSQLKTYVYATWTMNVGPCHHGMARPQVADGGTASNMVGSCELNKQPRTADEERSSSLGVGRGANNPPP